MVYFSRVEFLTKFVKDRTKTVFFFWGGGWGEQIIYFEREIIFRKLICRKYKFFLQASEWRWCVVVRHI